MKRPSIRLAGLWAASALTFGMVVLAPPAASAQVVAARPSSMQDNHRIVSAAFNRWAAGQGDFFNAILAPDAVWTIEGSGPSAGTFKRAGRLFEAGCPAVRRAHVDNGSTRLSSGVG